MKRTGIYRILVWIILSAFLVNRVIVYSYANETGDVKYVEISDELINSANNEGNYNIKVSSYEEIYGRQMKKYQIYHMKMLQNLNYAVILEKTILTIYI